MDKDNLYKKVEQLGFPLLEAEEVMNANSILADVVKSGDHRLWEGFPVMLANTLEKELFSYSNAVEHLETDKEKTLMRNLVMMSLSLYTFLELEFTFADRLYNSDNFDEKIFNDLLMHFKNGSNLPNFNGGLSTERVTNTFKNYYQRAEFDIKKVIEMQDDFEFEYAMSQIFSKKQKELFLKKLRREGLNKTEREYYSRVVKKKVLALSNTDLHKLAVRLIRE
jgi:hypothetical protein